MVERIRVGDKLPFFLYDTPYSAQNRIRDLLEESAPLTLVFMANFGHPVTRTFARRYAETRAELHDGGFALAVRSRADKLSKSIRRDTLPYPLLCDADGVLYEHLNIPQSGSALMSYSLEGWRILREAKRQGYVPVKGKPQQLPLTLVLDKDGTVLFCRYGTSLTDVPADCGAIQNMLEELELTPDEDEEMPADETVDEADDEFDEADAEEEISETAYERRASYPADESPTGDFIPAAALQGLEVQDLTTTTLSGLFDDPYADD